MVGLTKVFRNVFWTHQNELLQVYMNTTHLSLNNKITLEFLLDCQLFHGQNYNCFIKNHCQNYNGYIVNVLISTWTSCHSNDSLFCFTCIDELDSYMYQTVGHHAIEMYAEAIGLPLYRHTIQGSSTAVDKDYNPTPGDEVEDLYVLLKKIKVSFVH